MPWHQQQRPPPVHVPPGDYSYVSAPSPGSQTSPRHPPTSPHYQYVHAPHHGTSHPNNYSGTVPHRYVFPPSSRFQMPGAFDSYDYAPAYSHDPRGYDYSQHPGYDPTLDPRPVRRRARSRASSKASSANNDVQSEPADHVRRRGKSRRRRERERQPSKYRPTVESAPNSPSLLPVLPLDGSLLELDDEYMSSLPQSSLKFNGLEDDDEEEHPRDFYQWLKKNRHKFIHQRSAEMEAPIILERERKPYGGSTTTASTAASSPPPVDQPILKERERRQYSTHSEPELEERAPEIAQKKRNPYSYSPQQHYRTDQSSSSSPPSVSKEEKRRRDVPRDYSPTPIPPSRYDDRAEKRRSGVYAATGADMYYSREDPIAGYEAYPSLYRTHDPAVDAYYDYYGDRGKPASYDDRGRNGSIGSSHGTAASHRSSHRHHTHSSHGSPVNPSRRHTPAPAPPPPPEPEPEPEPESEPEPYYEPEPKSEPPASHSLVRVSSESEFSERSLASPYLALIPVCPKRKMVTRGEWFVAASVPDFFVCERCYEHHIHNTRFRHDFDPRKLEEGERVYCAFNTPRVLEKIWPATKEHGSLEIFDNYARFRSTLTNCTANTPTTHGVWYCIKASCSRYSLDGVDHQVNLLACEACYEDVIAGSEFAQYFERRTAANPQGLNSCHISVPYIETQILDKESDWLQFLRNVEYRLKDVTPCPRDGVVADTQRPWFKPLDTTLPIYICESCYCDGVVPTAFAGNFNELFMDDPEETRFCSMGAYTLTVVWEQAVDCKDLTIFLNAAEAALGRQCEPDGSYPPSHSSDWHELKDPNLNGFLVCTRCINTYFKPLGFLNQTRQVQERPLPVPAACALSSHYRNEIVNKLAEAANWRDFSIFADFIEDRRPLQLCPGPHPDTRTIWYGYGNFYACEECYLFKIHKSPFASHIKRMTRRPETHICNLGDEKGRHIWDMRDRRRIWGY